VSLLCAHSDKGKRLFLTSQKRVFQGLGWSLFFIVLCWLDCQLSARYSKQTFSQEKLFTHCKIYLDSPFSSASKGHLYDKNIFMDDPTITENPPLSPCQAQRKNAIPGILVRFLFTV
jgi:hypothetical protein